MIAAAVPLRPDIDALLSEETRALRGFLQLLEQEHAALVAGKADALLPLAEEKNRASAQLARLALHRAQAFAALGLGSGAAAVRAWLGRLSPRAPQRSAWQEMMALAARARDLNQACGELIRTQLQSNKQTLAVLLSASDQATLYGPDGQAFSGHGKRHLGCV